VQREVHKATAPSGDSLKFTYTSANFAESVRVGCSLTGGSSTFIHRGVASILSDKPYFIDRFSVASLPTRVGGVWTLNQVMAKSMLEGRRHSTPLTCLHNWTLLLKVCPRNGWAPWCVVMESTCVPRSKRPKTFPWDRTSGESSAGGVAGLCYGCFLGRPFCSPMPDIP
jgi:hypothetical protein